MMVRESTFEATWKAILAGKFDLITPVMTSTEGRCVATMRWIPTARAFWANRVMGSSIARPDVSIKSARSSITITTYGIVSNSKFSFKMYFKIM